MVPIYSINMQLVKKWTLALSIQWFYLTTLQLWWWIFIYFFFSPSKINGMSRRITIYESTPKNARSFPKTAHMQFQCSSTAPADWEEVLSSVTGLHSNLLTSRIALTPPCSPEHDSQLKMDFQWVIITVNNFKQRHQQRCPRVAYFFYHFMVSQISSVNLTWNRSCS